MSEPVLQFLPLAGLFLAFACLLMLLLSLQGERTRRQRLRRMTGAAPAPTAPSAGVFGRGLQRLAAQTAERVMVVRGGEARKSAALLISAGLPGRDAVLIHAFLKLVLPVLGIVITGVWLLLAAEEGRYWIAVQGLGLTLALSKLPDLVLGTLRRRRFEAVGKAFPDMLELLVITSEGGLGPSAALRRVAGELHGAAPELARELQQTVLEMNILPSRAEAYASLEARLPLPEISVFCNTLMQAERYGTPFANALRILMRDQRTARLIRIEERAARLPVLMTIPLILFIMPALFVVLVGPAALSILDNVMTGGFGP